MYMTRWISRQGAASPVACEFSAHAARTAKIVFRKAVAPGRGALCPVRGRTIQHRPDLFEGSMRFLRRNSFSQALDTKSHSDYQYNSMIENQMIEKWFSPVRSRNWAKGLDLNYVTASDPIAQCVMVSMPFQLHDGSEGFSHFRNWRSMEGLARIACRK